MRITRSKLSGDASRMSFLSIGATPALFTSRSRRPNRARTALTRRSGASSSPMSAWMYSTSPAEPRSAWRASCAWSSSRTPQTASFHPSRTSASAHPNPIPRVPPVTSATRSSITPPDPGTSTQERRCDDSRPFSASCTPFAPSSSPQRNGSSRATCRRKSSHWALNALS